MFNFKIDGKQYKRKKLKWMGYLLAISVATVQIPMMPVFATSNIETQGEQENKKTYIYVDGTAGEDTNDGKSAETPVKTIEKARELMEKNAVIWIQGKVLVTKSSALSNVKIETSLTGAIQVEEKGELCLDHVTLTGHSDTLIVNRGVVRIKRNNTFFSGKKAIDLDKAIENQGEGKVQKLLENKLEIAVPSITYQEVVSPTVITNESQGEVVFYYKVSGAEDSTYTKQLPTHGGTYIAKAVSAETNAYFAGTAACEFTIYKAKAQDITFPSAMVGKEGGRLGDLSIEEVSKEGTFHWVDQEAKIKEGEHSYQAYFIPNNLTDFDYSDLSGYEANTGMVYRDITIKGEREILEETSVTKELPIDTVRETPSTKEVVVEEESQGTNEEVLENKKEGDAVEEVAPEVILPEEVQAFLSKVDEISDIPNDDQVEALIQLSHMYDALGGDLQSQVPEKVKDRIRNLQGVASIYLKKNQGISVVGENLPWYVKLSVTIKENSEHSDRANVDEVILPYELKLWNVMTNEEYFLSEGESVTIHMPVKGLSNYKDIVIVHYLADGSTEYLVPTVYGETLTFKTSSFSPFDVAGSKVLVGGLGNMKEGTTNTPKKSNGSNPSKTTENKKTPSTQGESKKKSSANKNRYNQAPKTGDKAPIFILGAVLILAIILLVVLFITGKNKKKKESEKKEKDQK